MKKFIIACFVGLLVEILPIGVVGFFAAPSIMIVEDVSPLSYEESVQDIQDTSVKQGWNTPNTYKLDVSVHEAGYGVLPVSVVDLFHPELAGQDLAEDEARIVSS